MPLSPAPYRSPLRVLVVEDKPDWLEYLGDIFQDSELFDSGELFELTTACDYDGAYTALVNQYFDLAIVDLILHSAPAGEIEDWEGFWLLQDLHDLGLQSETAVVVLTTEDTGEVADRVLADYHALRYITKKQSRGEIGLRLRQVIRDQSDFGLRSTLSFAAGHDWDSILQTVSKAQLRRLTSPISPDEAIFELDHLTRRLDPPSGALHLSPMQPGHSGALVAKLGRTTAEGRAADSIIKMGMCEQIRTEMQRHTALQDFVKGHRTTSIRDYALGRYMGVLEYTLMGLDVDDVVPFRQYYLRGAVDDVVATVDTLFRTTCEPLHSSDKVERELGLSLEARYLDDLGTTREAIEQAFRFKFGTNNAGGNMLRLLPLPRRLPDPVSALMSGDIEATFDTATVLTHGDVHGDNVLVETATGTAWLIDFAAAGRGHWARDLATLECCIKYQYVDAHDPDRLLQFEDALTRDGWPAGTIDTDRWLDRPDLARAALVIGRLREIAAAMIPGVMDADQMRREYCAALLFNTLNYLRFHSRLKQKVRKNQVLVSAAVALEALRA